MSGRNACRSSRALLREFGALTRDQIVGEEVFGVPDRGVTLYPAFQFDPSGEIKPTIRKVLASLPRDRMSSWEIALWWTAANGWLRDRRPVDVVDEEPEAVAEAAGRLGAPSSL